MNAKAYFVKCVHEIINEHNFFYRGVMNDSECPWSYEDVAEALAIYFTNDEDCIYLLSEKHGHNLSFNMENGNLIILTVFVEMIAEKFETMFD